MQPRIYLAGPDVFLPNPQHAGAELKKLCEETGLQGVFPLDADLDTKSKSQQTLAFEISRANEELILSSDGLLANLSPFRGASADVGTVYEIGFARALGKPIVGYTDSDTLLLSRSLAWLERIGLPARQRPTGSFEDQSGMEIEDFSCVDNLMIDGGISHSGGQIFCPKAASAQGTIPVIAALRELARLLAK